VNGGGNPANDGCGPAATAVSGKCGGAGPAEAGHSVLLGAL